MMNALTCLMTRFNNDRRGVTALEYGLIASLVAIAIVAAVTTFGTNLAAEFTYIGGKI
jgi:pilus assembly protein Flp/PilA